MKLNIKVEKKWHTGGEAEEEQKVFGCKHYQRKCEKKCPECEEFFPCRLCHDDVKYYNEFNPKKNH